jgi:choline dehydrogenase-like flavoprotein
MGNDPRSSVVDAWHRLHESPNVFVVDASNHVTNGGFNPVLTIMALAYRAGRHMAGDWKGGGLR